MILTSPVFDSLFPRCPKARKASCLEVLQQMLPVYELASPLRLATFAAQIGHESADLLYFEELASGAAYEGRKDLGNINPGDGVKYKGRGAIQTTGLDNYKLMSRELGFDFVNNPEALATLPHALVSAGVYWRVHKLNALADAGRFNDVSIRINGRNKQGEPNGKADRDNRYIKAKAILGC